MITHFSLGIFQIQLFGEEMLGNNCIFEASIKLWVLKMLVLGKKDPVWALNLLNDDYIDV